MSDIPGGGPVDRSRPDDEPTINEAGADGFLVDGTDSFAVPGPVDVVPGEEVPEPPAVSRTRVLVTAGAVAAGLAFVVAVGRGGAGDAGTSLRSEDAAAPAFAFSQWGADDGAVVLVVPDPADADTLRRLEDGQVASEDGTIVGADDFADDEYAGDDDDYDDYDDYDASIPSYPEYDDESFDDPFTDDDFPSYRPPSSRRTPSPQRIVPRPRVTTPPAVVTTAPTTDPEAATTTMPPPDETTTTTTEAATTTAALTTTTLLSPPDQPTTTTPMCVATTITAATSTTQVGSTTDASTTTTTIAATTTTTQPDTSTTQQTTTTATTLPPCP
jgi:hypothetical protein